MGEDFNLSLPTFLYKGGIMKRFISFFLTLILLTSCLLAVPVSAEDGDLNSPLVTHWSEMPLKVKSNFFKNDVLEYDGFFVFRFATNRYQVFNFKLLDNCYFSIGNSYTYLYNSLYTSTDISCAYATYNSSTCEYIPHTSGSYVSISLFCLNNFSVNGTNMSVDTAKNNIIYSDIPIKYAGLTIFDPAKDNKSIVIPGILDKSGSSIGPQPLPSQPGDHDFIGPLPLIPIEGDPTFQGFKDWLIKNKKYEDLASYGINCTANNVSSIVDLWTGNYNSITSFFTGLKSTWSTISAVSQVKNIYNWFEEQWRIYKKSLITYETIPIESQVIDSSTDYDEDGNFISSETAYLKLILNVLNTFRNDFNNISSIINDNIIIISNNIYRIASQLSSIPQYIADSIYNNFVEPFNLVLEAINNIQIDGSKTTNNNINVNVDIDNIDNSNNEFSIAFGDLQIALENKFSFYNQLTEITNAVQTYDYGDEATPPEIYISAPDNLSIENISLDFSLYEPYREMIKKIIIAVAYISFAISLLHRLPQIIGGI